jgi:acetyl esterase/lipase
MNRKKELRPQDRMLADFLRAPTAEQKREVIERFAPHYFLLTPKPTKEKQDEQVEV